MKFFNTHFDEYLNDCNKNDLHDNIKLTKKSLDEFNNLILYGPPGSGKYTQCLKILKSYSPSELKYEKKFLHVYNKQTFSFKISDIHIEIDLSLLGCNSKVLWNELYNKIIDIAFTKSSGIFIIVCVNFHNIHNELLENFYSYMQTFNLNLIKLKFILITEELSFIHNNITNRCEIVYITKPTKSKYTKCIKNMTSSKLVIPNKITNIKNILANSINTRQNHENICDFIIEKMSHVDCFNYAQFRDIIYDLLILNMDIHESIWYIIKELYSKEKIKNDQLMTIIKKMYIFFQYYNNNYRPIYHLESFLLYLVSEINVY